jgi:hypothetical protein
MLPRRDFDPAALASTIPATPPLHHRYITRTSRYRAPCPLCGEAFPASIFDPFRDAFAPSLSAVRLSYCMTPIWNSVEVSAFIRGIRSNPELIFGLALTFAVPIAEYGIDKCGYADQTGHRGPTSVVH